MRTRHTPQNVPDPVSHPAARAWKELVPSSRGVERIEAIKRPAKNAKSAVFRLSAVRANGTDVIAKESFVEDTNLERTVYCEVLPHISVDGPRFIGWVSSQTVDKSWLFFEVVDGPPFDRNNEQHSLLAAEWLAIFHTETAHKAIDTNMPRGDPSFYRILLHQTVTVLSEVLPNPALSPPDHKLLRSISAQLETLNGCWAQVAEIYSTLPIALMHGDFVGKNFAIDTTHHRPQLRVFDWAEAHWGPTAADLHTVNTVAYRQTLHRQDPTLTAPWVEQAKHLGLVLRLISSVAWEASHLRYPWIERSMQKMGLYHRRLRQRYRKFGLASMNRTPHGWLIRNSDTAAATPALPSDLELEVKLQALIGGDLTLTTRTPSPYSSTFLTERVSTLTKSGRLELLCKYGSGYRDQLTRHRRGVDYEATIYRHLLPDHSLTTPRYHGTFRTDDSTHCLVLDFINGWRVNRTPNPTGLLATCVDLGRFHAQTPRTIPGLINLFDRSYFTRWAAAVQTPDPNEIHIKRAITKLAESQQLVIDILSDAPKTIIHGELDPDNVIIHRTRAVVVDWESAGLGPGILDFAILTQGHWEHELVDKCEAAYLEHSRPPDRALAIRYLAAARVFTAAQLLYHLSNKNTGRGEETFAAASEILSQLQLLLDPAAS